MFKLIEKLRQKDNHQKRSVAFLGSASIAGLIFLVWLSVSFIKFPGIEEGQKANSISTVDSLGRTFSRITESFGKEFEKLKENLSTNVEQYVSEDLEKDFNLKDQSQNQYIEDSDTAFDDGEEDLKEVSEEEKSEEVENAEISEEGVEDNSGQEEADSSEI